MLIPLVMWRERNLVHLAKRGITSSTFRRLATVAERRVDMGGLGDWAPAGLES